MPRPPEHSAASRPLDGAEAQQLAEAVADLLAAVRHHREDVHPPAEDHG